MLGVVRGWEGRDLHGSDPRPCERRMGQDSGFRVRVRVRVGVRVRVEVRVVGLGV